MGDFTLGSLMAVFPKPCQVPSQLQSDQPVKGSAGFGVGGEVRWGSHGWYGSTPEPLFDALKLPGFTRSVAASFQHHTALVKTFSLGLVARSQKNQQVSHHLIWQCPCFQRLSL